MKKRNIKRFVFLLILMLSFVPAMSVSATSDIENNVVESNNDRFGGTSPWLSGSQDNSIYENAIDAEEEEQDISANRPGRVEKYIAELFRNIGSALISVLQDNIGASLDTIVYGRVGSGQPNRVNIYAFELRKGNPYGVTASVCYALLRGIMFIFMGIQFVFQLAKAAWSGQTAKSRDEIKTFLPGMVFKFCALILMPYLLDVALYVRDVLLYGIKEVTGQMITGGATLSLSKVFLLNAERSGTFVDAVMYLGTVVLTIYFVFIYVSVAIDTLVCFVSFPFICIMHSRKKDMISGWVMTVFSNLMTPVIDAVLLLIPLLTSLMLSDVIKGVAIIQLVMCMLIIPARVRFKALLGVQSNERNGFLGAMAVMTFARALAGRIRQGAGKIADAVSDAKKSRMHGELAEVDRQEEEALLSGDSGRQKGRRGEESTYGADQKEAAGYGEAEGKECFGREMSSEEAQLSSAEENGQDISDGLSAESDVEEADVMPFAYSGSRGQGQTNLSEDGITANSRSGALREMDQKVEESQERLDKLRIERAGLTQKDKRLRRKMLDHKHGSEEYRALEKERAEVEENTAQLDSHIAAETGRLNRLRNQSRELHAAVGVRSTPTKFEDQRAEILRKRANISNFEAPEFKGVLTNDQMRDLYRKRAMVNSVKVVTGTAGAVAMGATAGSAAIYLGGSGAALATAGGMNAGGVIGETAVDIAAETGRAALSVGHRSYQAADMAASAYLMRRIQPAAMQVSANYSAQGNIDNGPEESHTVMEAGAALGDFDKTVANSVGEASIQQRILSDTGSVIQSVMTSKGGPKNSTALRAIQQANLQLEKEIAVMREEGSVVVTQELIREKRIEKQTEALSAEIMGQMERTCGYEKGSQIYMQAESAIREKIQEILKNRDKPII